MPKLTHELRVRFDEEAYEWLRQRAFLDRTALAETIRSCVEYAANNRYQRYSNDPSYVPTGSFDENEALIRIGEQAQERAPHQPILQQMSSEEIERIRSIYATSFEDTQWPPAAILTREG